MKPAFALVLTALLLGGCVPARQPAPTAAQVEPPSAWRVGLAGEVAVDPSWWALFGDPALGALERRALAANSDLAIAVARVQEARANERLARAQLFPTLDAGLGATRSRSLGALGSPVEATGVQPLFQASYEVDLFGRVASQTAAARQATLASAAQRDAVALSLVSAVASGYITLRALDARRDVLASTIAARAEALRLARSRARAGDTSDLEYRQAQAEYEGTAQLLPAADLAISRQENALSVLLGDAPRGIERGSRLEELRPPPVPAGLPADVLRRRPDVAQAEYSLAASDRSLDAARAQFLPAVRLTGSTGLTLSTALTDPVGVWSLGASILAPLFEGGRLTANVEGAAARRDQAAFAYRRTALTAFREVEDALAAVSRLSLQRDHLEAQRVAAAETLRHATNRYRAGYASYLEQLDAQRGLLGVDLSLVQLRADQLNALVALYQAMGGGWMGPPDVTSAFPTHGDGRR